MQDRSETDALLDTGGHPEVFADGLGDVQFVGANARLVLFAWRKMGGVYRRCVVAEMIRPLATLPPGLVELWRGVFAETVERVVN